MTNEETIAYFKECNETLISVAKDENVYDYEKKEIEAVCMKETFDANEMAIQALEQQPITWIVGEDNCQVAVRNMPIDKMQKICAIIGEVEQQPCEDAVSRQALIDKATSWDAHFADSERVVSLTDIMSLPSVTPQPKTGKWIEILVTNCTAEHKCSECGRVLETYHDYGKFDIDDLYKQYPYCHCGAKMGGGEE